MSFNLNFVALAPYVMTTLALFVPNMILSNKDIKMKKIDLICNKKFDAYRDFAERYSNLYNIRDTDWGSVYWDFSSKAYSVSLFADAETSAEIHKLLDMLKEHRPKSTPETDAQFSKCVDLLRESMLHDKYVK